MKKLLSKHFWEDQDVERLVGQILIIGVITASIVVLFGGILYLNLHGQNVVPDYRVFKGEGAGYTSFSGVFKGALSFSTTEIIQLGVLVLIATPILRVLCSLFAFVLERDKLYVFITLLVLGVILFSIFGGIKG